ncbi:hypothetical protein [Mucilaginibacter psychrotolerans]|uniref:Uncharacterized protein n=1 Tax=Mucilaginibacter psychrotolerans TaxID=1524096 RepID=A0A4Y8S6X6_9SPHI|nr:hypothetical protein [Mucilaginibacter psychrotolerans]TFF34381.1 hypothetical protein E2R66_22160 [Mucilaginibacter psychrotolerans]
MITINQYIQLLENYLKQHKQINTILTSNEADFAAYDKIVYPVAHIDYVTQRINGDNISHQFEIIIGDLFDPNIPGSEFEIYSDCNLIADDLITYFDNQFDVDYVIDPNTSIQKFTDANVDRVAGAVFVITFNQFRASDNCITPIDDNDDAVKETVMYYGSVSQLPTDFTGLSSTHTTEATLETGLNKGFAIALADGYSLQSVTDTSASNLDLSGLYVLNGALTAEDNTVYNLYYFEQSVPYSTSHKHKIKVR